MSKRKRDKVRALCSACAKGDVTAVIRLLDAEVDRDGASDTGMTALHWASNAGHIDIVELLVGAGADLDRVEPDSRWTPLHFACAKPEHETVARVLIDAGADVNALDNVQWSALHLACDRGYLDTVRALLEAGADVHAQSANGVTPREFALEQGHRDVLHCIESFHRERQAAYSLKSALSAMSTPGL